MSESNGLGVGGGYHRRFPCVTKSSGVNRLGTWILREINGISKREELVDVFIKKFELPAMTEKMKRNVEIHDIE